MKRFGIAAGALAVVVCLNSACEVSRSPRSNTEVTIDPAATGDIRGFVKFQGAPPAMPVIDFSSNPQCEREHPKPVREQTVMVGPDGGLANTLVWIKSGLPNAKWAVPDAPVKLDQAGCIYKPHVLAMMVNQELEVSNSDSVNHDVHAESRENEPSNESEPPRSSTIHRRFVHPEIWIPITCGVHPWMRSYVAVIAHPFFAVTGPDGAFDLKGIPPGSYVLQTVHEKFGRKELAVALKAKESKTADFAYME